MARFVRLKEINPSSWLVWTVRGGSSCLRDYRIEPASENRKLNIAEIRKLLNSEGNWSEKAPRHSVDDVAFWRDQQYLRNVESGLENPKAVERLLNTFKRRVKKILERGSDKELKIEFDYWKHIFSRIVNKKQFNHWDNDDASSKQCLDKGIGWSALMLERCRYQGKQCFVNTGQNQLDFTLAAMEVSFGISSKDNPFQPGEKDYVKPDGLGLRRDGSLCVVENKGPKDEADLLEATLQGVCGALAVFAKRSMIYRIAGEKGLNSRRPALRIRKIPKSRSSLGVYVLVAAKDFDGRPMFCWNSRLEQFGQLVLNAFPQLREIVYFCVEQNRQPEFSMIPVHGVIKKPE